MQSLLRFVPTSFTDAPVKVIKIHICLLGGEVISEWLSLDNPV